MERLASSVRERLVAGLVLIVPLVVTVFVAELVYGFIRRTLAPLITQIRDSSVWQGLAGSRLDWVPGGEFFVTLGLAFILLYVLGFVSTTYAARHLFAATESLLMRIPVLQSVYGSTRQMLDLVTHKERKAFKHLALFEYPRGGSYSLGFVTGEIRFSSDPRRYVSILVPMTPIPSQLFLIILPAEQIRVVEIGIEDGIKMVMSGGVIAPAELQTRPYFSPADLVNETPDGGR